MNVADFIREVTMFSNILQILMAALLGAGPALAEEFFASPDAQQRYMQAQQWLGADYVLAAQNSSAWEDKLVAALLVPSVSYMDPAGEVTLRALLGDAMRLAPQQPLTYVAALSVCWHDCDRGALLTRLRSLDPENAAVYYAVAQEAYRREDQHAAHRALQRAAHSRFFDDYDQRLLSVALQQLNERLQQRRELLPEGFRALDILVAMQARLPGAYKLPGCIDKTRYVPAPDLAQSCLGLGKLMARSQTMITAIIGLAIQRRAWETIGGKEAPQQLADVAAARVDMDALAKRSGAFYSELDPTGLGSPALSLRFWSLRARMGELGAVKWELAHPELFDTQTVGLPFDVHP